MAGRLDKKVLRNGMVILGEPMAQIESVAFGFMLPSGASLMPDGACGAGSVITDWIMRGAGAMDSRQLIDALDGLGLHRHGGVTSGNINFSCAMEASNLLKALKLYADIILRPTLDTAQFELSKQLAISDVIGMDDDPRQKVMTELTEKFYPDPLGRPTIGKVADLESLTAEKTAEIIKSNFNLSKTIFSIAGKYDFKAVCELLEELFDSDRADQLNGIKTGGRGEKYTHIQHEGAQVHIGLMCETIGPGHIDYYNANVAVSILSGGMSSRLFTEVREKRGLCYAVGARYSTVKQMSGISCYAGTTPDKAQETLDVIVAEFDKLKEGVTESEVQRAKVGLKSSLIMQSESSSSRSGGIGGDYYLLGRVRSIDEIKEEIEKASVESVTKFLKENPFRDYTVVTIGAESVKHGI
jgi:predicted Zn-dependent peptidase